MTIRKIVFETICGVILVAMAAGGPIYAGQGDPVREGKEVTYGINIGSGAYLDDANVTDGNIPYMQAAAAGFGDSPLSRTDANTITLKSATGQPAVLALSADAAEDNSDKWRVSVADGGDVTLETYQSGAWVVAATWTNAGGYTVTGALAGATLDTGQGANELYAMNQDVESTDAVAFATVDTGQGANELYDMDQNVLTTSSPTFVTTKNSGLTDTYIPYHVDDATGLADSPLTRTGAAAVTMTGTLTSTVGVTTPLITAPAASLAIKPTTDAVDAIQVQDKDGNNILNVDTVNNRVGIGTDAPYGTLDVLNGALSLRDSDVAQPATDYGPTNVYGYMGKYSSTNGGLYLRGFSDTDAQAFVIQGIIGSSNPTDTIPAVSIEARKSNGGTAVSALGNSETVLAIKNLSTVLTTVLGSGNVGIGTTAPDAALEINHATGDSMRLTYNDANGSAANYTDFSLSSTGNLSITPGTNASHVGIVGGQSVKKTNVSDAAYGTSALTQDYIVAFLTLTASRTATISTEDIESGTTTQPRVMIFKDESGDADSYPISIVLENGSTIDGQAAYSINQAYGSVTIYLNGTSGFCY